jgi:hypothetical protein
MKTFIAWKLPVRLVRQNTKRSAAATIHPGVHVRNPDVAQIR